MTDFEKEEFWKALQRLYDASLEQRQNIEAIGARMDAGFAEVSGNMNELAMRMNNLTGVVNNLSAIVSELGDISRRHEKRHDRAEVTVEAVLEDLRRHREGRGDLPGRQT